MSFTLISRKPVFRVRIGGEWDRGGKRGFVLLAVSPRVVLLNRGTARRVGQALQRFGESARAIEIPRPRRRARAKPAAGDSRK